MEIVVHRSRVNDMLNVAGVNRILVCTKIRNAYNLIDSIKTKYSINMLVDKEEHNAPIKKQKHDFKTVSCRNKFYNKRFK